MISALFDDETDARKGPVASNYSGWQGSQLVETYNKVTEAATKGNLNAREILAKPQRSQRSQQPRKKPDAFRAVTATSLRRMYPATKEKKR